MADYISREDLTNHLAICKKGTDIPNLAWATITAIECYIRDMPAADVIEVVRCKDCIYARDLGFGFGGKWYGSLFCVLNGPQTTSENDFCSHGQKRKEGEIEDDP